MKKVLSIILAAGFVMMAGSAFAQSADHDLDVKIPSLIQIRINSASGTPAVEFDYGTGSGNEQDYIDAVNNATTLATNGATDLSGVEVYANTSWEVTVSTTLDGFTPGVTGATGAGVDLTEIDVAPSGSVNTAVVTTLAPSFDMSGATTVASGVKTVGTWEGLGFDGDDYELTVNGDEDPGDYDYTVTYTIASL